MEDILPNIKNKLNLYQTKSLDLETSHKVNLLIKRHLQLKFKISKFIFNLIYFIIDNN